MARIRTIRPEFFRHEGLQDLAAEHGAHVMLVFAGLWGHCDKHGVFEFRPRHLKLDILPFIDFDMGKTLELLVEAGFIQKYEVEKKQYGFIASFESNQRIGGKEATEPSKLPVPPPTSQGSTGEAPVKHLGAQEGKGREEEGKRKGETRDALPTSRQPWPLGAIVSEKWIATAEGQRASVGMPPIDLRAAAQKFANYYSTKSGGLRKTATEWESCWLNFALKETAQNGRKSTVGDTVRALAAEYGSAGSSPDIAEF
ncbi:MAG: hypothetical protein EBR82_36960 [Caulobacteraceae bacterium]|nr:hypothetical protein [Caulobacteraceae bacterium]